MRLIDFTGMLNGLTPLYEAPGDGGAGGGDGAGGNGTGAANGDAVKPGATGTTGGDGSAGAPKPGTAGATVKFEDDPRYKGVLGDLQKERKTRQKYEADLAAERASLAAERKRVQALAGVTPKSDQDAANDAVRERFQQLFPKLGSLTDAQIDKLLSVAENAENIEATVNRQHTIHGKKMLDAAVQGMSKALGGEMTERQKQRLQWAYFQEAQNSPQFLERHESGDPTLIEEFVKGFMEDFVEPGRRTALAEQEKRMRGVPVSRDRSVVGASGKKLDLSNDKDFAEAAVQAFKGHGGAFGER